MGCQNLQFPKQPGFTTTSRDFLDGSETQTSQLNTICPDPPLLALFGMVSKIIEVDKYQQRLAQELQGADLSTGFHLARLSNVDVQEQYFVFPFSVGDSQCVIWSSRVCGNTSIKTLMALPTSVASLARVILLGSICQSYVHN